MAGRPQRFSDAGFGASSNAGLTFLVLGLFVTISVSFLALFHLSFPPPSSPDCLLCLERLLGFSLPNAPAVVGNSWSPIVVVDDDDDDD